MRHWSLLLFLSILFSACAVKENNSQKLKVIFDTDANNELDDQHALAYMLFNPAIFDIKGITVNATSSGFELQKHLDEAERIVKLCDWENRVKIISGASADYHEIINNINSEKFDGYEAVDFIIEEARSNQGEKLILIPVGKLTNIALALAKAPDIASKVKVVWLGSNWPEPGEYNLEEDTSAISPLLDNIDLEFEILTVRYGLESGTAAVSVSVDEIRSSMAGLGPIVDPVEGRHGGTFVCFGDYSIELFEKYGSDTRPLFDLCALAILKNPKWAEKTAATGVSFDGVHWGNYGNQKRIVHFWENFDQKGIIEDFNEVIRDSKTL